MSQYARHRDGHPDCHGSPTTLRVPPPVILKLPAVQEHLHGHHQSELHHLLHSPHAYGVARTNGARLAALQRGASRYGGVAGPLCASIGVPVREYTCIYMLVALDLSTTSRSRTSSTTAKEQVSNAVRGSPKRTARTRRHSGSLNPSAAAAGRVLSHSVVTSGAGGGTSHVKRKGSKMRRFQRLHSF